MPIQTACSSCSIKINVKDELIGKAIQCPKCGERIAVPASAIVTSTPVRVALPDDLLATADLPPSTKPGPDGTVDLPAGSAPAASLSSQGAEEGTASFLPGQDTEPSATASARVPAMVSVPGYEIECVLGRGGMGVVYKARHLTLKRTVALKMVLAGGHAGPAELARFRIEAEAVARLSHPNIVQIHEVGETDGRPYCSLEFVEGGNLAGKLDGKPMPARQAAKLVETLARAIQLAHSRNVVHRDLKPANILLTADGTPKITDFGLARQLDSDSGETQAGTVMGTPSYMAPEQASGQAHEAGPAADVYALGAILYDCLAGRPPFKGKTVFDTLEQVRTHEPPPPSHWQKSVPLDLDTICQKCLRKEPENRYASAAELADELVRVQQGEPILARPVGHIERVWRWCVRKPALASMAVGLAAVIVGAFAVVVWQLNETTAALAREENEKQQRQLAETGEDKQRKQRALAQVNALRDAAPGAVPGILADLEANRDAVLPRLRESFAEEVDRPRRMRLALALLPVEPERVRSDLTAWLLEVEVPAEVLLTRDALAPHKGALLDPMWAAVEQSGKGTAHQGLRAASVLAKYDPDNRRWDKVRDQVVEDLVAVNQVFLGTWSEAFRPAKGHLLPRLSAIFRDRSPERAAERKLATDLLADYAADQPRLLADLLMDADEKQFAVLYPRVKEHGDRSVAELLVEIDKKPSPQPLAQGERGWGEGDDGKEKLAKRQANAAVALLKMNKPEKVWPLLKHGDDPRLRSYLIDRMHPLGVDAGAIIKRLHVEEDITIRRALILSLGEYGAKDLAPDDRKALLATVQETYNTEDPGLHAAAEWLLRRWGEDDWLRKTNDASMKDAQRREKKINGIKDWVAKDKEKTPPQWYVNGQGQTMVVIPGPIEFVMGSPSLEKERYNNADGLGFERQHKHRIGRTFALAASPVTLDQYRQFHKDHGAAFPAMYIRSGAMPAVAIDWYSAARYCNWLSKQEGIPENQWCYDIRGEEVRLKERYLSLAGYRLPTESEMEFATRAGALTSRFFGETDDLLLKYGWYTKNSRGQTWPVGMLKPNDLGFFDVQGNVVTWCQEKFESYPPGKGGEAIEDVEDVTEAVFAIEAAQERSIRGGGFNLVPSYVRSSQRHSYQPGTRGYNNGIRVARTLPPASFVALPPTGKLELLKEALKFTKARFGLDHPETFNCIRKVADAYTQAGKSDLALPLYEENVKLTKDRYGSDHHDTLNCMNSLALAYQKAGKLKLAVPLFEETLKIKSARFGMEDLSNFISRYNLAMAYQADGQIARALPLLEQSLAQLQRFEQVLALRRAKLEPNHPDRLTCMNNLGTAYEAAGQLDKALPLYEEILPKIKVKRGPDHPDTLTSMHNLAMAYLNTRKGDLALPLFVELLATKKAKLGADHPDTLITMNNLAATYKGIGKRDLALALFEETLKLSRAKLGNDHSDTLAIMNNLAVTYKEAGKLNLALPLFKETYNLTKARFGPEHADVLRGSNILANLYRDIGKLDLALPFFEETHRLTKARFGPEHVNSRKTMNNLAAAYTDIGKLDLALPLFEENLKLTKAKLGPEHPDTLGFMGNLGKAYCDAGQGEKAAAVFKEFLAGERKRPLAGFESLLDQVANDLLKCRQFAAAESHIRESLALREKNQPDAWSTFYTQSILGGVLLRQKKYADAEPLLLAGFEGMKQRAKKIPRGQVRLPEAAERLVQLYEATGKKDQAAKWRLEQAKFGAGNAESTPPIIALKGTLTRDDPLDSFGPTSRSFHKVHLVPLESGKLYWIDLEGTFDTFLRIEDADKKVLFFNDDVSPPNNLHSRLVFTPSKKGNYRLVVTSFEPKATGSYTLAVRDAAKAGAAAVIKGRLEKKPGVHKIELVGGSPYTLELAGPNLGIILATGSGQGLAKSSAIPGNPARLDFTPAATGYFIVVVGRPNEAGEYTLSIQRYEAAKKLKSP